MTSKPIYADPEQVAKVKIDRHDQPDNYQRRLMKTLLDHAPSVHDCRDCGNPTIRGYVCYWCGSTYPGRPLDY